MNTPQIVCLCGSTKFKEDFEHWNKELTLRGVIVLTVGCFGHADGLKLTDQEKFALDVLHLAKIDLADNVMIIDKDGYIGESTAREIEYAKMRGKKITFTHGRRT